MPEAPGATCTWHLRCGSPVSSSPPLVACLSPLSLGRGLSLDHLNQKQYQAEVCHSVQKRAPGPFALEGGFPTPKFYVLYFESVSWKSRQGTESHSSSNVVLLPLGW